VSRPIKRCGREATTLASSPTDRNSRNRVAEASRNVRIAQHAARRNPIVSRHGAADVEDVQNAAGTQDAVSLSCDSGFGVVVQVVQHHRRQHAVELTVCER
jgi:hypothetical protein